MKPVVLPEVPRSKWAFFPTPGIWNVAPGGFEGLAFLFGRGGKVKGLRIRV